MPCTLDALASVPGYTGYSLNMDYYRYSQGDCLPMHNDYETNATGKNDVKGHDRRLAHVSYWHEKWDNNWGGELLIYKTVGERMFVQYCIIPKPGTLVLFQVPRPHRIARIDQYAEDHKRLSSAGWLYAKTEQPEECHRTQDKYGRVVAV